MLEPFRFPFSVPRFNHTTCALNLAARVVKVQASLAFVRSLAALTTLRVLEPASARFVCK